MTDEMLFQIILEADERLPLRSGFFGYRFQLVNLEKPLMIKYMPAMRSGMRGPVPSLRKRMLVRKPIYTLTRIPEMISIMPSKPIRFMKEQAPFP